MKNFDLTTDDFVELLLSKKFPKLISKKKIMEARAELEIEWKKLDRLKEINYNDYNKPMTI